MRYLRLSFFALVASLAVALSAQPSVAQAAAGAGGRVDGSLSDRHLLGGSARMDKAGVLWICRPGIADDLCAGDPSATIVQPGRTNRIARAHSAPNPPIDCFYVYPTASTQSMPNAALRVDPGIVAAAQLQAMRFSQVCKVYAPVYRQLTITGLMGRRKVGVPSSGRQQAPPHQGRVMSCNPPRNVIVFNRAPSSGLHRESVPTGHDYRSANRPHEQSLSLRVFTVREGEGS